MDRLKRVFICFNEGEFTKDYIKTSLEDEGYTFDFHFGNSISVVEEADEFWCFGDCKHKESYKKAVELGVDVWQMA